MEQIRLIQLPKFVDVRGNLSFVEQDSHIPFRVKRTYWIYDVPGGENRGGHAFRQNDEFIIALSGAFDVVIDNGYERKVVTLNRSYYGLLVPKGYWREMQNFSTNSVALILSSVDYDRSDYIEDYFEYKKYIQRGGK